MNKMTARDGNTTFQRVSKAAARKAWDAGQPVVLCPVKLYPFGGFRPSGLFQRNFKEEDNRKEFGLDVQTFDSLVRDFCWYNANCNETGKYASYWLAV